MTDIVENVDPVLVRIKKELADVLKLTSKTEKMAKLGMLKAATNAFQKTAPKSVDTFLVPLVACAFLLAGGLYFAGAVAAATIIGITNFGFVMLYSPGDKNFEKFITQKDAKSVHATIDRLISSHKEKSLLGITYATDLEHRLTEAFNPGASDRKQLDTLEVIAKCSKRQLSNLKLG